MDNGFFSLSFAEILIIAVLAFLLLKPSEMKELRRWAGKTLQNIVASDWWRTFVQTSRELKYFPRRLMLEANDNLDNEDQNRSSKS